jgi:hypothetical protein
VLNEFPAANVRFEVCFSGNQHNLIFGFILIVCVR